jgi:periplasmic divalent cation tolerance protein
VPTDVRVVLMTAPDPTTGARLAETLVNERLATCANLVPAVQSIYWWEGKVEHAGETLLILKTVEARVGELRERAVSLHPYDVPEVLVLEVAGGHAPYLDWVRRESAAEPTGGAQGSR